MADLYTSLVRAKQELNGGVLPAMTPIPEKLHAIIDPAFTIGMGALMEDPEKGLRCPVRGCGKWKRNLTTHANALHADIGGAAGIKKALSIPHNAAMVSSGFRESLSVHARRLRATTAFGSAPPSRARLLHAQRTCNRNRSTVGMRNLRNRCEAQMVQRMLAVRDRIGRTPSSTEVAAFDKDLYQAARYVYGSWAGAMAAFGLKAVPNGRPPWADGKDRVLESLRCWYDEHGALPTSKSSRYQTQTPLLPSTGTILKYLSTESWSVAMARATTALGITPPADTRRLDILRGLGDWYGAHGDLPTYDQNQSIDRSPKTASNSTILRHFGGSWSVAMKRVAEALDVESVYLYGGHPPGGAWTKGRRRKSGKVVRQQWEAGLRTAPVVARARSEA